MLKHFLLQDDIVTHTSSSKSSDESGASTECWNIFFLVKMQQVKGLTSSEVDKYQGMTVYGQLIYNKGANGEEYFLQ